MNFALKFKVFISFIPYKLHSTPHQISIGVDAIPVLVPTLTTTLGLRVIVMKENKYWHDSSDNYSPKIGVYSLVEMLWI